ncbi:MAG: RNA methyltransferase [Thermoplasmata archaeon HGW-Thermoplasmata-1]|nr:MAG: RNA methyltransferase [Thermoplasmata archaeon HGW-Thermoplasmata-1]
MRQKELEMLLQKIPPHPNPKVSLEQYQTPAGIAAEVLFTAYSQGDIEGKRVIDLGCGTGIFAIGAGLLGAKEVIGVDVDSDSLEVARSFASSLGVSEKVSFVQSGVSDFATASDTCIMNPPFGAQKGSRGADRLFVEKAIELAAVTYSLHMASTLDFLKKLVASLGGEADFAIFYDFPIKAQFHFHEKPRLDVRVVMLRYMQKA